MTLKQKIERRNTPEQAIVAAHEFFRETVDPDYGPTMKRVGKRWFLKSDYDEWRETSDLHISSKITAFLGTRFYDDQERLGIQPRLNVNMHNAKSVMHAVKVLAYQES